MNRKLLFAFLFVVLAGAVLIFFFGSKILNSSVQAGVESFGPKLTKTDVRLERVDLSVFSGKGKLSGLSVDNPEGFSEGQVFSLGMIDVHMEPASVFRETVVINRLHIQEPLIHYERKLDTSNLQTLLDNIKDATGGDQPSGGEGAPKEESARKDAKKLVIRKLVVEEGRVAASALGQGVELKLPRIEMDDLGEGNGKKTVAEVARRILDRIMRSVGSAVANPREFLPEGGEQALEQGKKKLDEAADDLKKMFE